MKKEIKLTQKQQQVLETLGNMLEKENFNKISVSDIYCNMTAVKQIVKPNWFDRTFNKLEELGLVKKENMKYEVKGGFKKGEIIETYSYVLTELGFEYLGITNDNQNEQEMRTIEIMKFDGDATTTEVEKNRKIIDQLKILSCGTMGTLLREMGYTGETTYDVTDQLYEELIYYCEASDKKFSCWQEVFNDYKNNRIFIER